MKFLNLCAAREIPKHMQDALNEQPHRSGMYNWIFVHKGSIGTYWEYQNNLEDFDVIQVNCSPIDMTFVSEIRNKLQNSSTKLVLNNDYVCEKWGKWVSQGTVNPYQYDSIQKMGDMVFGTEPHQVSNMIKGSFCMPHPTNTEMMKKVGSDYESDSIGFIYHWWAGETYLPHRTVEMAKKQFKVASSRLYAYQPETDECLKWEKSMWDDKIGIQDFPTFAQMIQGERIVYDPNPCHTYGRNGVELACFRKPVVGSNRVFSYNKLFPELTCDPYDVNATMKAFELGLGTSEKKEQMLDRAYEDVEFFNYKNSKTRWKEAFDIAIDRGGHEWYAKNG